LDLENIKRIKFVRFGGKTMTKYLGLHETLDLHELLTFKNLCLTKATTMSVLAQDPELKAILSEDAASGTQHILQLQKFLTDRSESQ
jgi:similar to spore coat protein